jgi:hypothetical protein
VARAIVTGLEEYRYRDRAGTLRLARKGVEVDIPEKELRRAIAYGWITPLPGYEPIDLKPRFHPPRAWKHRPSLWFVVPAHGRLELSRICLGHLAGVCKDLRRRGIDASAVVIANDGNLEVAKRLGFATIERENLLGAKFNDGYKAAADNCIDFVVPCGSDDLVDANLIATTLPEGDTVSAYRRMAIVDEKGERFYIFDVTYDGGSGIKIWPTRLFAPCGYRPAQENRHRALDASTMAGVRKATGRDIAFVYHKTDGLEIVDFKSPEQLNGYDRIRESFRESKERRDPFAALAKTGRYSAPTLKALQSFYGLAA